MGDGSWTRSGANCKKVECPKSYACTASDCGAGNLPHSDKVLYPPLLEHEAPVTVEREVKCNPGHGFGGDSSYHGHPVERGAHGLHFRGGRNVECGLRCRYYLPLVVV